MNSENNNNKEADEPNHHSSRSEGGSEYRHLAASTSDSSSYPSTLPSCCGYYCEVDPVTASGAQSDSGHANATPQDFAMNRVQFGDGVVYDAWFYLCNRHSLFALFLQHRSNPFSRTARVATLLCSLAFAFVLSTFLGIYLDPTLCQQSSCGTCLAGNYNNLAKSNFSSNCVENDAYSGHSWFSSSSTWAGVPFCVRDFIRFRLRSTTNGLGGCAWFSRKNASTEFPIFPRSNGCLDPLYSSISISDENNILYQYDDKIVQSTNDVNWLDFLSSATNSTPAVIIAEDDGLCDALPQFARNATSGDATFDMVNDPEASAYRFLFSEIAAVCVLIFTRMLAIVSTCPCSLRGNRRRVTVCCCQTAGKCCFLFLVSMGAVFLVVGLALLSCVDHENRVVVSFVVTKLIAFALEVGALILFFAAAYTLQRFCRYSMCCRLVCAPFGCGLYEPAGAAGDDDSHDVDEKSAGEVVLLAPHIDDVKPASMQLQEPLLHERSA